MGWVFCGRASWAIKAGWVTMPNRPSPARSVATNSAPPVPLP